MKIIASVVVGAGLLVPMLAFAAPDFVTTYSCPIERTSSVRQAQRWFDRQDPSPSDIHAKFLAKEKYAKAMSYATCVRHANIIIKGWPMFLW